LYSGDEWFNCWQSFSTTMIMSDTTNKVFGPEEQPKSAIARLLKSVLE